MQSAILDIDLSAITANYRLLKQRHAQKNIAAVVKADAYGLGMPIIAKRLWQEGQKDFFVATLAEGIALRETLPEANIGVFNGLLAGEEKDYRHYNLMPVLNDLGQVERWQDSGLGIGDSGIIHIDTGMTRLGLSATDLKKLLTESPIPNPESLFLISHLACAPDPAHPKNAEQLSRFREALKMFPGAKASLANSAGLFLPPEFHFDIARPGCALYGINPTQGPNPMQQVARLAAPILQIRALDRDETIGYDATYSAKKGNRIAIVALGYADGWPRALGNKGSAYIGNHKVPIAGIISMDMLALDVTTIPEAELSKAAEAEFINATQTVDDIARECGTIGYEIFTGIGDRVKRRYSGEEID